MNHLLNPNLIVLKDTLAKDRNLDLEGFNSRWLGFCQYYPELIPPGLFFLEIELCFSTSLWFTLKSYKELPKLTEANKRCHFIEKMNYLDLARETTTRLDREANRRKLKRNSRCYQEFFKKNRKIIYKKVLDTNILCVQNNIINLEAQRKADNYSRVVENWRTKRHVYVEYAKDFAAIKAEESASLAEQIARQYDEDLMLLDKIYQKAIDRLEEYLKNLLTL